MSEHESPKTRHQVVPERPSQSTTSVDSDAHRGETLVASPSARVANYFASRQGAARAAVARFMRKPDGPSNRSTATIPSGGGQSLPPSTQAHMERRLGADLSSVKVHTGGESAIAASAVGARAFTVGNDVHFNAGQFAPGTKEGDRLLAHELTHVVQGQRSGIQRKAESDSAKDDGGMAEPEVSQPGEPAEQEADAVGDKVASELHESRESGGAATNETGDAPKEQAPAIGAKLSDGKVMRAKKMPLRRARPLRPLRGKSI